MVFAGADKSWNPNAVVLVFTVQEDAFGKSTREARIYGVPQTHGAVRIVDASGDNVTMVSFDGKPVIFDTINRVFFFPKTLSDQALGSVFDILPTAKSSAPIPTITLRSTPSSVNP
jgi:hypothetical protein